MIHQGLGDARRYGGKVGIGPVGIAEAVQRFSLAVGDGQPGRGLFAVRRKVAPAGVVEQCCGKAGLPVQLETVGAQAAGDIWQLAVAHALIEGAVRREADGVAGAVDHPVIEGRRIAGQMSGLQAGGFDFVVEPQAGGGEKGDDKATGQPVATAGGGCVGAHVMIVFVVGFYVISILGSRRRGVF